MTRDVPYHKAISTLTWVTFAMHPIITFAGWAAPLFGANAGPALLEAVKQTSHHLFFTYSEANSPLMGSANANDSTAEDWRATCPSSTVAPSLNPRSSRRPPPYPPPSVTTFILSASHGWEVGQLAGFLQGPLIFLVSFQPKLVFNLC